MPAPKTTTTPKEKTLTPAAVEKACAKAHDRITAEMANSSFAAPMDLACKLFTKYLKEELK
jgi:hypothetical protein